MRLLRNTLVRRLNLRGEVIMWVLCQDPCKTFDEARKRATEIGRENFDSIHKERYGLFFLRTVYVVLWWKWIVYRR